MKDYINEFGSFIYDKLQEKLKSHEKYQWLHKIYFEEIISQKAENKLKLISAKNY